MRFNFSICLLSLISGIVIYLFSASAIGIFLGIFARTIAQFALLIMLTISPMQMLSGGNSPIENQPGWISSGLILRQ